MLPIKVILLAALISSQAAWSNPPMVDKNSSINVFQQLNQANTLEKQGLLKQSLTIIQALEAQALPNDQITLAHGRLLVKSGLAKKAITMLQPLVLEHGNDWRPWFWMGTALLLEKKYIDAGFHLDEALAREGGNASIWVQRAIIEQARGQSLSAINILEVANGIEEDRADVLLNLAYNYELTQNLKKAEHYFRQFLFLSAKHKRYARLRSEVIYRLAQYQG